MPDESKIVQIDKLVDALENSPEALKKIYAILERAEEILNQCRSWLKRIFAVFQGQFPDEKSDVHEGLLEKTELLALLVKRLYRLLNGEQPSGEEGESLDMGDSAEEAEGNLMDLYNLKVRDFNEKLGFVQGREMDVLQDGLLNEVLEVADGFEKEEMDVIKQSAAEKIEAMFTEEEKREIIAFADEIWEEIFPETNVDKFAKWATGQKDLEDYQEILLAPANGIENVVMGVWELVSSPVESYEDLKGAVDTVSGMSYEDFCSCARVLKFMYQRMDKTDLVAPSISFIVGSLFIFGGSAKLMKLMKGKKLPAALAELTGVVGRARHESGSLARAKDMPTKLIEEIDYQHVLEHLEDHVK